MNDFFQIGPQLKNQYTSDRLLQSYIKSYVPKEVSHEWDHELKIFGERVISDIYAWGLQAESHLPQLISHSPWGKPIYQVDVSPAWYALDKVSAEEGLIATGYEKKFGSYSRVLQYIKLFLFHPSSAFYSCPLAMTDGAAKLIDVHGSQELKKNAFKNLTSRDPNKFWTSGQWMTERSGGSDVSGTETIAQSTGAGSYALYGTKWFTSATTSQMAMTLAREENQKNLSLFYLELRNDKNELDKIEVLRLKDKLGTKALPTAELKLNGTRAQRVGEVGEGVKNISTLFNITRIHNAIAATSSAKRILTLLMDYSEKRVAFKNNIIDKPLHRNLLSQLIAEYTGCFLLTMNAAQLLGEDENIKDSNAHRVLRIITPLAKLYSAKLNMNITSECVEGFGGAGYVEDVGIAKFLRDSQVLTIWEGTTNVLCLDVLRAIHKENVLPDFINCVEDRLKKCGDPGLEEFRTQLIEELKKISNDATAYLKTDIAEQELRARLFAYNLARLYIKSLLLEFAFISKSPEYLAVLDYWIKFQKLFDLSDVSPIQTSLIMKSF